MTTDKNYLAFINSLKQEIIKSLYQAARLANREQLLLYFKTGRMLLEKVKTKKWGTKVLEQIAANLQNTINNMFLQSLSSLYFTVYCIKDTGCGKPTH
jgi:hypothetical protein